MHIYVKNIQNISERYALFPTDMMSDLMNDVNPLVYQCAIDAFVAIGKHTAHEEVNSH